MEKSWSTLIRMYYEMLDKERGVKGQAKVERAYRDLERFTWQHPPWRHRLPVKHNVAIPMWRQMGGYKKELKRFFPY